MSAVVHGRTCLKVAHHPSGGYLHADRDDRPFTVDGLTYCGRCHHVIDGDADMVASDYQYGDDEFSAEGVP